MRIQKFIPILLPDTIIIIVLIIFSYINRKEKFETTAPVTDAKTERKSEIANKIFGFISKDTKYKDYLEFLVSIKNISINLLDEEVFFDFKFTAKNNQLTTDYIMSKMTDV